MYGGDRREQKLTSQQDVDPEVSTASALQENTKGLSESMGRLEMKVELTDREEDGEDDLENVAAG